ncbi:MAG: alpha/beta hydrolase [Pseudomonadota bacterium]
MNTGTQHIEVDWAGRTVRIEHEWITGAHAQSPLMVFLHEGLGSVSMWRDFPERVCTATGFAGLVYSRPGYGQSTPREADENWLPDFMHRQSDFLSALLQALEVDVNARKPWLLGHSDGASIALIYAAQHPQAVGGVIAIAPHILVEDISVQSIAQARTAYLETDLKQRLARHHHDVDSAFWGWNRIWLDPNFRNWSIETEISAIRCPVLAVQGLNDEYGTLEQVRGIARRLPQAGVLELADCGHSPHRDQPEALLDGIAKFVGVNVERQRPNALHA